MTSQEDVLTAVRNNNLGTSTESNNSTPGPYSPLRMVSSSKQTTGSESSREHLAVKSLAVPAPSSNTSPDNVLMWPIFLNNYNKNCLQDAVFSQAPPGIHSNEYGAKKGVKATFQEDKVPALMERFFHMVHIRNPIVDQEDLQRNARIVLEDGLSWDEGSCLVLLACALGRIAEPFQGGQNMANIPPISYGKAPSSLDYSDLAEAESYFTLARRRLGVLNQSIAAVQCFFLCGVFYMYTFRPLDAFQHFHQASVIYQVYSKSQNGSSTTQYDNRTEQTLFWSCFKSEW
ncbi:hypothetical protein N7456_003287 [Penicillium angulare]|uniref:Uncharacterized protein n=1 Tax=Penicillium angulare TaxID=116970 RepID=A0A9W9FVV3_9EURO|nr:hypothetical protein N7456_003287 [Penicillium angulare]